MTNAGILYASFAILASLYAVSWVYMIYYHCHRKAEIKRLKARATDLARHLEERGNTFLESSSALGENLREQSKWVRKKYPQTHEMIMNQVYVSWRSLEEAKIDFQDFRNAIESLEQL